MKNMLSYYDYDSLQRLYLIDRYYTIKHWKSREKCIFTYNSEGRVICDSVFVYDRDCHKKIEIYSYSIKGKLLYQTALFHNRKDRIKYKEVIEMGEDGNPTSRKVYRKEKLVFSLDEITQEEIHLELYHDLSNGCKPNY